MTCHHRALRRPWPVLLLALSAVYAQQALADPALLRTDGLYRSEVQTNSEGTEYINVLRFAPDGRVFFTPVAMPASQERVCGWFRPELERPYWARAADYRIEGNRLAFRTSSLNATTVFEGTIDSGTLRMQLVVPTRNNLTYALTFAFTPCP